MAQPLDARIRAAMGHGARAATVTDLIEEIGIAIAAARAELERQDALSKSAAASEEEAEAAADEAAKLSRKIVRLEAKQQQLRDRHEELMNSERRRRLLAEYGEVKGRRDALAAELKDRWPALCAEIVDLIERIQASDAECVKINHSLRGDERLISAEAIARECSATFYAENSPITRFDRIRLPSLRGRHMEEMAWPRPDLHRQAVAEIPL